MNHCDLAAIISINCIISISFTLLASVIPLELERRHSDSTYTGIIFGCFSIPWIIIPVFVTTSCSEKIRRRNALQIGLIILGISLCIYGALRYVPDEQKAVFLASSTITRIREGGGSALAFTIYLPLDLLFP